MKAITGIFTDMDATSTTVARLREVMKDDQINVLTPTSGTRDIKKIPTDADMPPVGGPMGATLGGSLGGALGLATVIAIPGVGLASALGVAWSLTLGTVGGVTGWFVGERADHSLSGGIPVDELFFYEEAVRDGHSVVIALAANHDEETRARAILEEAGATEIDAARASWWAGLREAEWADWREHHDAGTQFEVIEDDYIHGFTTALRPSFRELRYEDALRRLRPARLEGRNMTAFKHGYQRGRNYLLGIRPPKVKEAGEETSS